MVRLLEPARLRRHVRHLLCSARSGMVGRRLSGLFSVLLSARDAGCAGCHYTVSRVVAGGLGLCPAGAPAAGTGGGAGGGRCRAVSKPYFLARSPSVVRASP